VRTQLRAMTIKRRKQTSNVCRRNDGLNLEGRSGIEPECKAMHGFRVPAPPSAHGEVLLRSRAERNIIVLNW
jgi:hypothetical protein